MIERTEACFGIKPDWLAADTAYGSAPNLEWLVNEKAIAPHVPVIDKSKRDDAYILSGGLHLRQGPQYLYVPGGENAENQRQIGQWWRDAALYGEYLIAAHVPSSPNAERNRHNARCHAI